MAASSSRQVEIAMEGVGPSSRHDDRITGEGADHQHAAGETEAVSDNTRMDPILYRYATTSKAERDVFQTSIRACFGVTVWTMWSTLASRVQALFPAMCGVSASNIPNHVVLLVQSSENKVSPRRNTVLHLAACTGNVELIQLIIQHFPGLVCKANEDGQLPLHVAASVGHLSAVRCLVNSCQGSTLNVKDGRGNTALHVSLENFHQQVAKFLVMEDGSTAHSPNNTGKTPLCIAAETANLALVQTMVDNTPDSTTDYWQGSKGNSILRAAIIWRKKAIGGLVKSSINHPPAFWMVFLLFFQFWGLLCLAIISVLKTIQVTWLASIHTNMYRGVLQTILNKIDSPLSRKKGESPPINSGDEEWMTPLTLAAYIGNFVAVRVLLHEFTGLAYERDENNSLPIHVASRKGHSRVVEEILNQCPDLRESRDNDGSNILHVAAAHGRVNLVTYIIKRRDCQVLTNERDNNGNTPLHIAVQNWHPKIAQILSRYHVYGSVSLNSLNNAGMTALDVAEKNEKVEREKLFRRKLTLMALNLANAPRSQERTAAKSKLMTEDSDSRTTGNSNNLLFSKESVNTLLLVSTLVATITFAAGFSIPGGYKTSGDEEGVPNFLTNWLFQIFLICNTMAMCGSITTSIALMWAQTNDPNVIYAAMRFTLPVLGLTLTMMSFAFLAGVLLIVYKLLWLRIVVMVMGLIITGVILMLSVPLTDMSVSQYESKAARIIVYCSFRMFMLVTRYNIDVDQHKRWSL